MSSMVESVNEHGSLSTLCDTIRKDKMLRFLLGLPASDEDLAAMAPSHGCHLMEGGRTKKPLHIEKPGGSPPDAALASLVLKETQGGEQKKPSAHADLNKIIEGLVVSRNLVYFVALREHADIVLCGLLVQHRSSFFLNKCDDEPLSVTGPQSTDGNRAAAKQKFSPTITRRERYYLWVCLTDLEEKLIVLHQNLRQPSLDQSLSKIEIWVQGATQGPAASEQKQAGDRQSGGPRVGSPEGCGSPDGLVGFGVQRLKHGFRCLVWDLMEQKQEILFPHPCHGRIPNFRGRESASENLAALSTFKSARVIKINPSLAQEHVRFLALACSKVLITPGSDCAAPFYKIDPSFLSRKQIQRAATKGGARTLGSMVSLAGLGNLRVQLVVVGSVVVNPITGARLGKGQGYSDIEYAIMAQLGVVSNRSTVVATVVHETQLVNDLPDVVMEHHDLPVNLIATPKRVIFTRCSFDKPEQVNWSAVTDEMLASMPALKDLQDLVEHKRRELECYVNDALDGEMLDERELAYTARHQSDRHRRTYARTSAMRGM